MPPRRAAPSPTPARRSASSTGRRRRRCRPSRAHERRRDRARGLRRHRLRPGRRRRRLPRLSAARAPATSPSTRTARSPSRTPSTDAPALRQTFDVAEQPEQRRRPHAPSADGTGLFTYDGNGYSWNAQIPASPTLGYVYVTPGAGPRPGLRRRRVHRWSPSWAGARAASRSTRPTRALRQTLLAQRWRDDGIVFYVPSAASAATATVYSSQTAQPQAGKTYTQYTQYYFTAADMAAHAKDTTPPAPAFQVLTRRGRRDAAAHGRPLPAARESRRARGRQRALQARGEPGPGPLWHLEWSGITQPTTLVVEALASGCPFQGFLSPHAPRRAAAPDLLHARRDPERVVDGRGLHQRPVRRPGLSDCWHAGPHGLALERRRLPLLPTPTMSPKPIARSFVQVAPQPHDPADWDWYQGFDVGTRLRHR